MKNVYLMAFFLFSFITSLSQTTRIEGIIHNRPNYKLTLAYPEDPVYGYEYIDTTYTDESGRFNFKFILNDKRPIQLFYHFSDSSRQFNQQMFTVWVEPNKTINIEINMDTSIGYSKDCKAENELLKELRLNSWAEQVKYYFLDFDFNKNQEIIDKRCIEKQKLVDEYAKNNPNKIEFIKYLKTEIYFESIRNKYHYFTEYCFKNNLSTIEFVASKEFYDFFYSIKINGDYDFHSFKYRNFLKEYFDHKTTLFIKGKDLEYTLQAFRDINKALKVGTEINQFQKAFILKMSLTYVQNIDSIAKAIEFFKKEYPTYKHLNYFDKRFSEKKSIALKLKTLPDISLKDTGGNLISLSSFKGKVLFIDFWGTWCKPCMQEMSFSKKIEEEINNKNVEFLYINNDVDSDITWKRSIDRLKLKGIHLKGDKEAITKLENYLVFTNYPFYVLVDKYGYIQNNSMVRPSTNAKELILDLLK